MSDRVCSSCGTVNTGAHVYCTQCGGILENLSPGDEAQHAPVTTAVAKRRQERIDADRPGPHSLFSRIRGLIVYFFWVAAGVVVVLSLMSPKDRQPPLQEIPNARDIVRRVMASAAFSPAVISQQLVNSCLSQQGALTWESPVRMVPMPVWDSSRVEINAGAITLFTTITVAGCPLRFSETFRLERGAGSWNLVPEAATIGLLDLPRAFLPAVTMLLRPGFESFAAELSSLSASRNVVIRPGLVEFSTR